MLFATACKGSANLEASKFHADKRLCHEIPTLCQKKDHVCLKNATDFLHAKTLPNEVFQRLIILARDLQCLCGDGVFHVPRGALCYST